MPPVLTVAALRRDLAEERAAHTQSKRDLRQARIDRDGWQVSHEQMDRALTQALADLERETETVDRLRRRLKRALREEAPDDESPPPLPPPPRGRDSGAARILNPEGILVQRPRPDDPPPVITV